jgi:hypothetical protein
MTAKELKELVCDLPDDTKIEFATKKYSNSEQGQIYLGAGSHTTLYSKSEVELEQNKEKNTFRITIEL